MSFKDTQSYKELQADWRWIHEMDPEAAAAADQWVKEHPEEWKELKHMLLKRIRERFNYISSFPELERQATAFHQELAQIYPIRTIITTNWDTYFEDYCGAIPITIPEDFAFWDDNSRCVLKIHGSIQNLSSIIATSEDYKKRFSELQNGIVGATLKSILATKTVVFIGFSFGDEDFAAGRLKVLYR